MIIKKRYEHQHVELCKSCKGEGQQLVSELNDNISVRKFSTLTGSKDNNNFKMKIMNKTRWFLIGLHLYIFPHEPELGDITALYNWKPIKMGILYTLKFRYKIKYWGYSLNSHQ